MVNLTALTALNEFRWERAGPTRDFRGVAGNLIAGKKYYQFVEEETKVPWFIIAVIHERESGQSWLRSLAQGDPWNEVSTHKPAGRGPFSSWEAAAYDALVNCPPYAARNTDWSAGGALTMLEQYNGLGYANRGVPSPYIWSGTNQYVKGKYIRDGVYSPETVDVQLGCAGLIMAMEALDDSVMFTDPVTPDIVEVASAPQRSFWDWLKGT